MALPPNKSPPKKPAPAAPQVNSPAPMRISLSKGGVKAGGGITSMLLAEKRAQSNAKAMDESPGVPLEDRVFAIPTLSGMKDAAAPKILEKFLIEIAPKLALPKTSRLILEAFSNIDVTAEKVAQALKENPYYEFIFFKVIESFGKRETLPSLEGAIILLGMQNSRNLVAALQMNRIVTSTHPAWSKEGKLVTAPTELVKYALKAEETVLSKKGGYADTAFSAGLVFDFLACIARSGDGDSKKIMEYLDAIFNHGLRTASIAAEIAKLLPDFGFTKFLFSSCLIHDIGKIVLLMLEPRYLEFVEESRKREWPRPIRQFVEKRDFGVDHATLGSMVCRSFGLLRQVEKAIQFHHKPYLLKATNRNLYQLAAMIALSTNIANNFKKTENMEDPILALWKSPEVRDFKIDMKAVASAVAKNVQI